MEICLLPSIKGLSNKNQKFDRLYFLSLMRHIEMEELLWE